MCKCSIRRIRQYTACSILFTDIDILYVCLTSYVYANSIFNIKIHHIINIQSLSLALILFTCFFYLYIVFNVNFSLNRILHFYLENLQTILNPIKLFSLSLSKIRELNRFFCIKSSIPLSATLCVLCMFVCIHFHDLAN